MTKGIPAVIAFAAALFGTGLQTARAQNVNFDSGSLIIPMDVDYQNAGMLKAFGLVDKLLRAGVSVNWCILSGKSNLYLGATQFPSAPGDSIDFTASATDFKTNAIITAHGYRGGPFVIASADAAAASPIITAWQSSNVTTVHVASQAFSAPVRLVLTASPKIAVLADGNESILFGYLVAAGIPDESNLAWAGTSVDVLSPAQIAGPSTSNASDGALFRASGQPEFCALATAHWSDSSPDIPNVVPEIKSFLQFPVHLFAECLSVLAIEGEPPTGGQAKLLTSAGFTTAAQPSSLHFSAVDQPFAQLDGSFTTVGGSVPAYALATGSTYADNSAVMMRNSTVSSVGTGDLWIGGYYNATCTLSSLGNCTNVGPKGKVTYLGGHSYSTSLPILSNPRTQGTRLFLNSLFAGSCAHAEGQPVISITAAAPATTNSPTITFTLSFGNTGPGPVLDIVLTDTLPANATFVSATGGGTFSAGAVTWNLGDLASGASGSVSVTVNVSTAGTYTNAATAAFAIGLTSKSATSNSTQTVYSASFGAPSGLLAMATSATTANVTWLPVSGADHYEIFSRSNGATFALRGTSATTQFSDSALTQATTYLYEVRAVDGAGTTSPFSNIDFATTVMFADDPLVGGSTAVKAIHMNELRQAVNAMRATAALSPLTFTDTIDTNTTVQASHINQLRSGLTQARSAFGVGSSYTDDPLVTGSTAIKAIHVQEIRDAVK